MTDLEKTKRCAKAIGYTIEHELGDEGIDGRWIVCNGEWYRPLHDDAQCMVLEDYLIERGYLHYEDGNHVFYTWPLETSEFTFSADFKDKAGRRRAIVECVANVQAAQSDVPR